MSNQTVDSRRTVSVDNRQINERVADWLNNLLGWHYKHMKVHTFVSHNTPLSSLIKDLGLQTLFPQCDAWEIKTDVTGIIVGKNEVHLSLIDFASRSPTLTDVFQLSAYARVANPVLCMLISPQPPVDPVITLLKDYGRLDVLQYGPQRRHIRIARWESTRGEILYDTIIPKGRLL
jgi:hypothetical protein